MTRKQAREAATVMLAWADGKEVESQLHGKIEWLPTDSPQWDWAWNNYRIKPTAKLRPWTADEVPLGAWMRTQVDREYRWLIVNSGHRPHRASWLKSCEHSIDGGKTWFPCGVMEESK